MNNQVLYNISKIIERDSKSTTYKFALLRGVIDTGLIEKWLLYYYPILESQTTIPQINGDANLAFGNQLKKLIRFMKCVVASMHSTMI